jgi:hypothetical protein
MLACAGARARLCVHTAADDAVLDMLARQGVCILPGPPGRKSFLAQMALLAAAQSGRPTTAVSRCCLSGPAECVGLMPVRRSVPGRCRYWSAVPPSWVPVARTAPVRRVRCGAVLPVTAPPGMGWQATIAGKTDATNHVVAG